MKRDEITIENEALCVTISRHGAELTSVYDKVLNCPLLKPVGGEYWEGTAPILFPICGRLHNGETTVDGKIYRMKAHGFAQKADFSVSEQEAARVTLRFSGNAEILKEQYPFPFLLSIEFALNGRSLAVRIAVENCGDREMPFSIGCHPGFLLPNDGKGRLEDAYLEFDPPATPDAWVLSPRAYLTRETVPYPLKDGRYLPLRNEDFRIDGIFLERSGTAVTLRSRVSNRAIRVNYSDFTYLGLWRPYDPLADFLCIEPWNGAPDYDGEGTALYEKRDMILLPPKETRSFAYTVTSIGAP